MKRTVDALIDILQTLILQYQALEEVEAEKTDVIINREGDALQELIQQQDDIVRSIGESEEKRKTVTAMIANQCRKDPSAVTASVLTPYLDETQQSNFTLAVSSLSQVMRRVQRLTEANKKCLDDNMAFFDAVLDSLRESVTMDEGYSAAGFVKRSSSAALFNRTV